MAERTVEQVELGIAVAAAVRRWQSVDMTYMPIYPGGQSQFDEDCQTLAVAHMNGLSDLAQLRKDAERYQGLLARAVSGLKHMGPFKRRIGDDPHPMDCTLAGRVSQVFGLGMTSSIDLCRELSQDPEWVEEN